MRFAAPSMVGCVLATVAAVVLGGTAWIVIAVLAGLFLALGSTT